MRPPRGVQRAAAHLRALAPEAEMLRMKQAARRPASTLASSTYDVLLRSVSTLLEEARRSAARSVNAVMTATYWEIGRRIVTYEQRGAERAAYGEALLKQLSVDLIKQFGRGFSERNLEQMRLFYLGWPISQTPSAKSHRAPVRSFPLSWSHYVRLLSVEDPHVAHYALGDLSHKVFASRYKLQLPAPEILRRELEAEQRRLEQRLTGRGS